MATDAGQAMPSRQLATGNWSTATDRRPPPAAIPRNDGGHASLAQSLHLRSSMNARRAFILVLLLFAGTASAAPGVFT
ncbi:MAG: hypothetical protein M3Q69_01815, partial [Acidobacteriota bacterium]|nr:hypothetical protein [Acidobacteriota bacterium]